MPYKDPIKQKEYFKKYSKKWRENNKDKVKEYEIRNKDKIRLKDKKWKERNPEKVLGYMKKYFDKLGEHYNISGSKFNYALLSWSKTIRMRDKRCKICNSVKILFHIILSIKMLNLNYL